MRRAAAIPHYEVRWPYWRLQITSVIFAVSLGIASTMTDIAGAVTLFLAVAALILLIFYPSYAIGVLVLYVTVVERGLGVTASRYGYFAIFFVAAIVLKTRQDHRGIDKIDIVHVASASWVVLSSLLVYTPWRETQVAGTGELLGIIAFSWLCYVTRPSIWASKVALLISALLIAIVVLSTGESAEARVEALGLNSNYLAVVLAAGAVAALAWGGHGKRRWILRSAAFSLSSAAIVTTQSRGGAAMAIAGFAIYYLVRFSQRGVTPERTRISGIAVRRTFTAIAAVALVGLVVTLFPDVSPDHAIIFRRDAGAIAQSDSLRLALFSAAPDLIAASPIVGHGVGAFGPVAYGRGLIWVEQNSHNEILRLLVELGILGGVLVLLVLYWSIRRTEISSLPIAGVLLVSLLFVNVLGSLQTVAWFFPLAYGVSVGTDRTPRRYGYGT